MKKWLWLIAVILVVTAAYAGPGIQQYPNNPQQYPNNPQQYPNNPQQYPYNPQQDPYGQQQYGPNADISYFYGMLAPYGEWIQLNPYGFVWVPRHMGYRWRPYSNGHWVYTDYGWTWMSYEPWGDIVFHYGRWGWDNEIGWFWMPDSTWGPAWVTWRSSDQYMGWAPLQPGFNFSLGMNFNSNSLNIPISFWIFVQASQFLDQNLYPYVLPYERNQTIMGYTTMHNNLYTRNNRIINDGIGVNDVRRITRRNFNTYTLRDIQRPGAARIVGQEVQMFRPNVRLNKAARPKIFLNRDQAVRDLAPVKVFEPRGQQNIDAEAVAVEKRQIEEKKLLEMSHQQEINNLQLKRDEEAKKLRDANLKAKIQKDYEAKIADLKKSHAVETQQLTARHQNDIQQVEKVKKGKKVTETTAPKGKRKK